ncbi:hypothetical protein M8494_28725 [Serratia ureilytica]
MSATGLWKQNAQEERSSLKASCSAAKSMKPPPSSASPSAERRLTTWTSICTGAARRGSRRSIR